MPEVDTKNVDVSSDLGGDLDADLDTEAEKPEASAEGVKAESKASPDTSNGETPLKAESKPSSRLDSSKEMAALRRLERQQGRDRMLARLNSVAKEKGFDDLDSLLNSVNKAAPAESPEQPKKTSEKAQLAEQVDNYRALSQKQERIIRQLKDQLADLKMTTSLERQALEAEVNDVDYAVSLLRRKAKDLSEDEAKTFDPKAYFAELKASKPYLFKQTAESKPEPKKEPANTGPAKQDKTAKADKIEKAEDKEKQVDVRKMSRREYSEYLAKNGLRDPKTLV